MKFNQLGPVGAEVSGVNLKGLTGSQIKHVKKAFLRYNVLIFRNQDLSPAEFKKVSNIWGCLLYTSDAADE